MGDGFSHIVSIPFSGRRRLASCSATVSLPQDDARFSAEHLFHWPLSTGGLHLESRRLPSPHRHSTNHREATAAHRHRAASPTGVIEAALAIRKIATALY